MDDIVLVVRETNKHVFQKAPEYEIKLLKGSFPNSQLLPTKIFLTQEEAELARGVLFCLVKQNPKNAFNEWMIYCKMVFRLMNTSNRLVY